jgi:hypothetical protein
MALKPTHKKDFAWYAVVLPRLMAAGGLRQRVCGIEHYIYHRVLSGPPPTIPFDMFQLAVGRVWLR